MLKLKNGDVYQPVFTDILEFQRFAKREEDAHGGHSGGQDPDILVGEAKGVVLNPLGSMYSLMWRERNSR